MSATRTPCYVDESGTEVMHAVHTVIEVLYTLCSLGREEFEGEGRFALAVSRTELGRDVHTAGRGRSSGMVS